MAYDVRHLNNHYLSSVFLQDPPILFNEPFYNIETNEFETRPSNRKYIPAIEDARIIKFSYCCEESGIIYPIFLKINGAWKAITIGKTCIYEVQPENFKDINDEDAEDENTNVIITDVLVPEGVSFSIDYAVSIV